jgi:uncharacterized protein YqgQ
MPDRLAKIRARLDAWEKQKATGTDGYFDGIGHYMRQFEADMGFLVDEVERLRDDLTLEREHFAFMASCLRNRKAEVERLRNGANYAK